MAYNFITEGAMLIVIISWEFLAKCLWSLSSAEANSWQPQI